MQEFIGSYRILSKLGTGGMGAVYRGVHEITGEIAAIKTVIPISEHYLPGIRREIRALARVQHPGLVKIIAEGEQDGVPWYAMELVEGEPLMDFLKPALSQPEVLTVFRRLCTALSYLHGEGIVHRDLKPENVIVSNEGNPVLVDFGVVTEFPRDISRESFSVDYGLSGTVLYMAPEQIRGELQDARTDLYAVGCLLYEAISGAPPFTGSTIQILQAHLNESPKLIQGISREMRSLLDGLLAKDPRDRIGHADDVSNWLKKLGAADDPVDLTHAPRPYLYRSSLAGRENQMKELQRLLEGIWSGQGKIIFIGGESGAGKTRLAMEIAGRASNQEIRVLAGECFEGGANALEVFRKPLLSIADLCRSKERHWVERVLGNRGRVLADFVPQLAGIQQIQNQPEPQELDSRETLLRLNTSLWETFAALTADGPLLLFLDDFHWADELSIQALEFAATSNFLEERNMMVVTAYRTEEMPESLRAMMHRISSKIDEIYLPRLNLRAVQTIVSDMLAMHEPPAALVWHVAEHSEGNPFFVAEYLRAALDEQILSRDKAGHWEIAGEKIFTSFESLPLPNSLKELIGRRLSGVSPSLRQLVNAAVILGRESSSDMLAYVSGLPDPEYLDAVSEAIRRQILEEPAPGSLRFVHDKIREKAAEEIPQTETTFLHRRAAEAMESRSKTANEYASLLAFHWEAAGEIAKSRPYFLSAARYAAARFAYEESERLYRKLLGLVDEPGVENAIALNELARDIYCVQGRSDQAIETHQRALEIARQENDPGIEAQILSSFANTLRLTGRMIEAQNACENALALFQKTSNRKAEGRTLRILAIIHWHQGNLEQARKFCEQALAINKEVNDRQAEGMTLGIMGILPWQEGNLDEARNHFTEALNIAQEVGYRRFEGAMLANLGIIYMNLGQFKESLKCQEEALKIHREVGDRRAEAVTLSNLGQVNSAIGHPEKSRVFFSKALEMHRIVGDRQAESQTLCALATLERRTFQNLDEASRLLDRSEKIAREMGAVLDIAQCLCERGFQSLARGESALPYLEEAENYVRLNKIGKNSELGRFLEELRSAIQKSS